MGKVSKTGAFRLEDKMTHSNSIFPRMPARMQDLLVKIESINLHLTQSHSRPILKRLFHPS